MGGRSEYMIQCHSLRLPERTSRFHTRPGSWTSKRGEEEAWIRRYKVKRRREGKKGEVVKIAGGEWKENEGPTRRSQKVSD